jgi:hypothetical protein
VFQNGNHKQYSARFEKAENGRSPTVEPCVEAPLLFSTLYPLQIPKARAEDHIKEG